MNLFIIPLIRYFLRAPGISAQIMKQVPLGYLVGPGPLGRTLSSFGDTQTLLNRFISILIGFLTTLAGLWFLTNLIIGAFQWLSAGGSQDKIVQARNQIINAIIGLTIVVAAYGIAGLVASLLGLPIFDPLSVLPPEITSP
jgi:hypothetical protein